MAKCKMCGYDQEYSAMYEFQFPKLVIEYDTAYEILCTDQKIRLVNKTIREYHKYASELLDKMYVLQEKLLNEKSS